jgi:hypothetical protein
VVVHPYISCYFSGWGGGVVYPNICVTMRVARLQDASVFSRTRNVITTCGQKSELGMVTPDHSRQWRNPPGCPAAMTWKEQRSWVPPSLWWQIKRRHCTFPKEIHSKNGTCEPVGSVDKSPRGTQTQVCRWEYLDIPCDASANGTT